MHPLLKWMLAAAAATGLLKSLSFVGVLPGLPAADILAAEVILVSAFLLGRRLLTGLLRVRECGARETVMAMGLGLGSLSVIFFLVALLGLISGPAAWAALLIPAVLSLIRAGNILFCPTEESDRKAPHSAAEGVMLGLILFFGALVLQMALTPPTARDALIHHLAIPKIFITKGDLAEIPFSIYSYYPMNFNMLYMGAMLISSDITARLLHFSVYLFTGVALFGVIAGYYGRRYAYLGVLLFSSIPVVVRVSSWAYVDLALTFFAFSSFLALAGWADGKRPSQGADGNGLLWVAALLAGFGMSTKYNGLILFFLALMAVLYLTQFKGRGAAWCLASTAIFAALAILAASPWFIRDLVLTGNPIYPMFINLLGGEEWQPGRINIPSLMIRRVLHGQSWVYDLLVPISVSTSYSRNDFNIDGPLGPVFLVALPLLIFFRSKPRAISVAGGMALVYYLFTLSASGIRLRYLIPIYPFLILLGVHGLHGLATRGRRWGVSATTTAVAAILAINLYLILPLYSVVSPPAFLTGRLDRAQYLREKIHDYDAYEFMNSKLPRNVKVMFLFTGNDGYYLDREYFYDSYFLGYTMKNILKRAADGGQVADELEKIGITHLFINWYFLTANFRESVPPDEASVFQDFINKHLYPLYTTGDETVYALKGTGD